MQLSLKSVLGVFIFLIFLSGNVFAQQKIRPGFDPKEYISLLSLGFFGNSIADTNLRKIKQDIYTKVYTSPEVGLKNQWWLYRRNDSVAVIFIRGTVGDKVSWAANFYAAMIPAIGSLQLNDTTVFKYKLAADEKAAVHVGWTVSLASMAPDMVAKIKDQYHLGVREFYIMGHSQGGAIAFLTLSYLHYLQEDGGLPRDIHFKTYCSAAPKPGNTYYAYDFEFITKGGWAFTIVNRADWVPEAPYTVQRIQDMNEPNPLIHSKELLKNQRFLLRLIGGVLYKKINNKPEKTQRMYTKYLGKKLYKSIISKVLPQFKEPDYLPVSYYVRSGCPIVLMPDQEYFEMFKDTGKDYFVHHHFAPYYYLLKKQYIY